MVKKLICWLRGHCWAWFSSTSTFPQYEPDADQLYICTRCGITERRPYFNMVKAFINAGPRTLAILDRNELYDDIIRKDST